MTLKFEVEVDASEDNVLYIKHLLLEGNLNRVGRTKVHYLGTDRKEKEWAGGVEYQAYQEGRMSL